MRACVRACVNACDMSACITLACVLNRFDVDKDGRLSFEEFSLALANFDIEHKMTIRLS